tara:strand:+ start:156 stop:560 length:405 start_codon:yes stop_codon:yes gene_type:complete
LQIKHNCPVCRRSVWDYRKCKISNKKIEKKSPYVRTVPPKTRSKTKQSRIQRLENYLNDSHNRLSEANNIHQKIIIVEKIFKEIFHNVSLLRQMNESYIQSINNLIYNLENNTYIINNNYMDKIKLWKYKLNNT